MICGMGLGSDPAGPTRPHPHKHSLGWANQDKPLPAQQTPHPDPATPCPAEGSPSPWAPSEEEEEEDEGQANPWLRGCFRQEIPAASFPPPWPGITKPLRPAEIREEQETSISPGAAGRGNWIQSEQSGAGSCSREQKACRMRRDHSVLWDLRQEQGSGHRVRAWLWPAVSHCQAG